MTNHTDNSNFLFVLIVLMVLATALGIMPDLSAQLETTRFQLQQFTSNLLNPITLVRIFHSDRCMPDSYARSNRSFTCIGPGLELTDQGEVNLFRIPYPYSPHPYAGW